MIFDANFQNTTTSHSAESLCEIFCRSASDSNVTFCGEEETPVAENDPETPTNERFNDHETIESEDVHSDCISDSEEEICKGKLK